jgi:hypothetical protein
VSRSQLSRFEHERSGRSQSGLARSSLLLLIIVGLLAVGTIVVFSFGRGLSERFDAHPSPPTQTELDGGTPASPPEDREPARRVAEIQAANSKPRPAAKVEEGRDDASQGSGVIRGRITAVPGTELPKVWTLIIEPHPFLQGHERAVTRRIEFTNGEHEFKVDGLPLAGYSVRAEAAGLNDVACNALLVPGSDNVFVNPQFSPAGFIDGNLIDAHGAPVEGMLVTLSSEPAHARRSARTDALGNYVIPSVTDGAYTLSIGTPEAPLLKPDSLSFKAPSLRFPTRQLPETGTLRISTMDDSGRVLGDTEVSGFSSSGGALRVTTDRRGQAMVRYLLPGKYRLDAKVEDGRRAGQWVEVSTQPETIVELRLKP